MSNANQKIQITEKDESSLDGMNVHHLSAQYQNYSDAYIVIDTWYEDTTIYICYQRLETDEEFETRTNREKNARKLSKQIRVQQKEKQKEKDLAEYNRIKDKYGIE